MRFRGTIASWPDLVLRVCQGGVGRIRLCRSDWNQSHRRILRTVLVFCSTVGFRRCRCSGYRGTPRLKDHWPQERYCPRQSSSKGRRNERQTSKCRRPMLQLLCPGRTTAHPTRIPSPQQHICWPWIPIPGWTDNSAWLWRISKPHSRDFQGGPRGVSIMLEARSIDATLNEPCEIAEIFERQGCINNHWSFLQWKHDVDYLLSLITPCCREIWANTLRPGEALGYVLDKGINILNDNKITHDPGLPSLFGKGTCQFRLQKMIANSKCTSWEIKELADVVYWRDATEQKKEPQVITRREDLVILRPIYLLHVAFPCFRCLRPVQTAPAAWPGYTGFCSVQCVI